MAGRLRLLVPIVCSTAFAGCGGGQSPLSPKSKPAHDISTLWWWMLAVASVVFLGAVFMITIAWLRRKREGLPYLGRRENVANGLVVVFGLLVPVAVLGVVFVIANLVVTKDTDAPAAGSTAMSIHVIGHQWFWEVRYQGTPAVTANEIHIPVRTRVDVAVNTADVIHSFWVPELNRKIDMIPGQTGRILLYADRPGQYRGQCAEFCGVQHAHMAMKVIAEPAATFRGWLANQSRPARAPTTPAQRLGRQTFLTTACSDCHTLRGTAARGVIGPDLTHLMSRSTLAALTIPNRPDELARWILDPQHVKPGNKMPGLKLDAAETRNLVDFLESLK
ncbi:MAG: cytochrome c oxidase subunit II [Actinobacteria bacterium]|nr:MAG: cytochrome c oxidase subunit II [Actinomycetota bacterium]